MPSFEDVTKERIDIARTIAGHETIEIDGHRYFRWSYDHSNHDVDRLMDKSWARGAVFGIVFATVVSSVLYGLLITVLFSAKG